jgi:hypothetical protein
VGYLLTPLTFVNTIEATHLVRASTIFRDALLAILMVTSTECAA